MTWALNWTCAAKLGCQGAHGCHFGLQLGLQVPPQSAPDLQFCSPLQHFKHFFENRLLCFPSVLGLLFGSSWGLLGRLLGLTWILLGSTWGLLGAFGAHLRASGRLLGSTWSILGASCPNLGPFWVPTGRQVSVKGAFRMPNERQVGAKWPPNRCAKLGSKLDCQNGCKFQRTS